jgi:virulence-associated protein VagC
LIVLWGAAALARHREATPDRSEAFRLPTIKRNDVDKVVLTRAGDTTVLVRKDTNSWTANGHPASARAIADLLSSLTDSAQGSELVAERRASQAGLGVDSAGGTRAQIIKSGKTLADLVVGHRSPDFSGGYVRQSNQESTYLVRGKLVEVLSRSSDEWRDHQIATVPPDSVATLEVSRGVKRYQLRRAGSGWSLSTGGTVDTSRVTDLLAAYRTLDATGFASPAQADSAHFTKPDRRARLLRKDGTPIVGLLFDSTAAGFWVRPDTGNTIYKVDSYTADRLTPADSGLKVKAAVKK